MNMFNSCKGGWCHTEARHRARSRNADVFAPSISSNRSSLLLFSPNSKTHHKPPLAVRSLLMTIYSPRSKTLSCDTSTAFIYVSSLQHRLLALVVYVETLEPVVTP